MTRICDARTPDPAAAELCSRHFHFQPSPTFSLALTHSGRSARPNKTARFAHTIATLACSNAYQRTLNVHCTQRECARARHRTHFPLPIERAHTLTYTSPPRMYIASQTHTRIYARLTNMYIHTPITSDYEQTLTFRAQHSRRLHINNVYIR